MESQPQKPEFRNNPGKLSPMHSKRRLSFNQNDWMLAHLSRDMRFPTMWYVPSAKGSDQPMHMRSLIRAFARGLNIL